MAFIKWFKDVSEDDGIELAVLANARFPVPQGFIVTAEACKKVIEQASGNVAQIPKEIQEEIIDSYELLGVRHTTQAEAIMHGTEEVVTVRPSKSRMPVFHVKGGQNVVQAVAACWSSTSSMPVIIHRMINGEKSGTMMTPSTNEEILIQAAHGLGEAVSGGLVKPDSYIVDKSTLAVKNFRLGEQEFLVFRDQKTGKLAKEKLSEGDRRLRVLTDKEIYQVARYGKKISEHYKAPRNIEWAIERDKVHILQCKPLTQKKEEIQNKGVQHEQAQTQHPRKETTTKIRVIVDLLEHAENIAKQTDADGALIRPELIIASSNTHPAHYISEKRDEEYTAHIVNGVKKAAAAFKDKSIVVCNSDLRSDEYRNLKGGNKEPYETDPIIGWRGIRRLLDEPQILQAELSAIKQLHEQGYKNVSIMLPFVSSSEEIKKAGELMKKSGIDVPISAMIETPSSCLSIADICKQGIKTVCINIDNLAQLTLGVDKHNKRVQQHFNIMHPAVLSLIATAIKGCKEHGIEISACGDISPEMARFLMKHDINSIYTRPENVHKIRNAVGVG